MSKFREFGEGAIQILSAPGGSDSYTIAIAMLIIAFYGEPDLVDAIIHYLLGK